MASEGVKEASQQKSGDSIDTVEPKEKKHRGIPEAGFLDDVDKFMLKGGESAEETIKKLDEQLRKYKYMEINLLAKKKRLQGQVPDLMSSLEMVKLLQNNKEKGTPCHSRFLVSDQLYANAVVPPSEKVCLWLGANVMLEYTIEEADNLLTKNLATAKNNLEELQDDLDFLRDQYTTTEVNMARVYNWDVKRRQAAKIQS
ncbi:prefoldin subunit 3 [Exaiptasia diaphana]|uniref:Prefoldin subunit 3 n=1 Tax=Exaiptasia diaphana TaxID=2652724 RepID=A0A913Y2X0_EXADI|nr:prefoldin subunit 3 [Exaiptasia diaphana]KXJ22771.1 Prefoldin subunit 3 [Exaiptasia diaphana]